MRAVLWSMMAALVGNKVDTPVDDTPVDADEPSNDEPRYVPRSDDGFLYGETVDTGVGTFDLGPVGPPNRKARRRAKNQHK